MRSRFLLAKSPTVFVCDIVASSSSEMSFTDESSSAAYMSSSMPLSFTDDLIGTTVPLDLVVNGELQTPAQLRAPIMRPLQLFKTEARLFAQRLHRRQAALPPLGSIFVEYRVLGRVLLISRCFHTPGSPNLPECNCLPRPQREHRPRITFSKEQELPVPSHEAFL